MRYKKEILPVIVNYQICKINRNKKANYIQSYLKEVRMR